jgi:anti-sigma factor RsiW
MKLFRRKQLSCQELVELVTDYLEGALPRAQRVAFEQHLQACDGCDAYLEQMRTMLDVLGRIDGDDLDDAVVEEWLEAFRGWRTD